MIEQIQISAKNLGTVALEDFCPKCFWIKLKMSNKLPWQIFPGIFSSIDAYTKKCVHAWIDKNPGVSWLNDLGNIVGYKKVPSWKESMVFIDEYKILLTGIPDDALVKDDGCVVIPDYKTAKYTANQDKLKPMYDIQLNCYKPILENFGIKPVTELYLVYFQPITDEETAKGYAHMNGFDMGFEAKPLQVEIDEGPMNEAMAKVRMIYEHPEAPEGVEGCKDCAILEQIMDHVNFGG